MLTDKIYNLKKDFVPMYKKLLRSIADNDHKVLGDLCEKNLYTEFTDSIPTILRDVDKIEVLNEDAEQDEFNMQVVDFF